MNAQDRIVLCEPQCWGFEHARFNAALLQSVLLACPSATVLFLGEAEHLAWVQRELANEPDMEGLSRIEWKSIEITGRRVLRWRRIPSECRSHGQALHQLRQPGGRTLVLCSCTNTGLAVTKLLMYLGAHKGRTVVATLHSALASLEEKPPREWRNRLLRFQNIIHLPHPRGLRYLVLGESVRRWAGHYLPREMRHFWSIDQPYRWTIRAGTPVLSRPLPLRFGFFGVSEPIKRFDLFNRLAGEFSVPGKVAFSLVGFLIESVKSGLSAIHVPDISLEPLAPQEFARRANQLTYALSLSEPEHYRLTASASFLDALSYGKPGIYLRNPYVEYYFDQMGDIGYLCDTYEQIRDLLARLIADFPTQRYCAQVANITRGRERFAPEIVSARLRDIL